MYTYVIPEQFVVTNSGLLPLDCLYQMKKKRCLWHKIDSHVFKGRNFCIKFEPVFAVLVFKHTRRTLKQLMQKDGIKPAGDAVHRLKI